MQKYFVPILLTAVSLAPAYGCDLCSIYHVAAAEARPGHGFTFSVAEQFTHFGTLQEDGERVPTPTHQSMNSSVSQMVLGYTFNDWVSVQFNAPLIHREFQRPEGLAMDRGSESGFGDVSFLATLTPVRVIRGESSLIWSVYSGLKLPSGNSRRLLEELQEVEVEGAPESGIHGHDLALGSGSFDGVFGTALFARYQRAFFQASLTYSLRSEGDYQYRYANDVMWTGGPGVFVWQGKTWSTALQFVVNGEDKGLDRFGGVAAADTGITAVYAGPQIAVTWADTLTLGVNLDLPIALNNSALQAVPDYRIRGNITWRF